MMQLLFLMILQSHFSNTLACCDCDSSTCYDPGGIILTRPEEKEVICSLRSTKDMSLTFCGCYPFDYLNDSTLCQCGTLQRGCSNNCYIPSECTVCTCRRPVGDCEWYTKCLHAHYSYCSGSDNYALDYGKVYCQAFDRNFHLFSKEGQKWVDSVKLCLQIALNKYVMSDWKQSCSELKQTALQTYHECYLGHAPSDSLCNISCLDLLTVLHTIKGALINDYSQMVTKVWEAVKKCTKNFDRCIQGPNFTLIRLFLQTAPSANLLMSCNGSCLVNSIGKSLFGKLVLPKTISIDWFIIPKHSADDLVVDILLADQVIPTQFHNTTSSGLLAVSEQLISFIATPKKATVQGKAFDISRVSVCRDVECKDFKISSDFDASTSTAISLTGGIAVSIAIVTAVFAYFNHI